MKICYIPGRQGEAIEEAWLEDDEGERVCSLTADQLKVAQAQMASGRPVELPCEPEPQPAAPKRYALPYSPPPVFEGGLVCNSDLTSRWQAGLVHPFERTFFRAWTHPEIDEPEER